ncbi:SIMPL domain-containing protein [Wenyingzhuangia sp. IMCC45467]
MKKIKLIIAVTFIVVCGFTTLNAQTISLTAKGEVEVTPDIASTNISITKTNKNADDLKEIILDISKNLNHKLLKLKIDKKDIQTSNIQINKEYDWVKSEKVFKGYRASISTSVTFRDLKNLEKIYADLLSNEDITVNGIQYDYSKKEEAENDAYIKALSNANILADKLSKEIENRPKLLTSDNKKVKIIINSISNNGESPTPSPRPVMYKTNVSFEASDNMATPSIDINAGTITYVKSLTVVYQLL